MLRNFDSNLFRDGFVSRNRLAMFPETLKIALNRIRGHQSSLFKRIAFGNQAGQSRAGDNIATSYVGSHHHRKVQDSHRSHYITNLPID